MHRFINLVSVCVRIEWTVIWLHPFISYSHSVAKTMGGSNYGRFIEREEKKHTREKRLGNTVGFLGNSKAKSMWILMNLRDRSHHVCVFFWGSVDAGKALHHLNSMLTTLHLQQRGDNGLSKCKMYISGKMFSKWDKYWRSREEQESI